MVFSSYYFFYVVKYMHRKEVNKLLFLCIYSSEGSQIITYFHNNAALKIPFIIILLVPVYLIAIALCPRSHLAAVEWR